MEEEMDTLVLMWQLAMLSKHSTSSGIGLDIETNEFPPYAVPTMISAPLVNPTPGDYFGANGYQMGIDIASTNYAMEGGTKFHQQQRWWHMNQVPLSVPAFLFASLGHHKSLHEAA